MTKIKILWPAVLIVALIAAGSVQADVSAKKAADIGKKNLRELVDQSYHYRVDYDTIVVVPVHSKTMWKNDFYLLYFLKDHYFQVEMEVDKVTGDPVILAMGKMSQPYHEFPGGTFNYKYFCADSIVSSSSLRRRLQQDSAQLVYFGVIPKLGKRGVIWEVYSTEGAIYISLAGPQIPIDQLIRDINTTQQKGGNFVVDSIRMTEIMGEFDRLKTLTDEEKQALGLDQPTLDSLVAALTEERKNIIIKFPSLGRNFPMEE